jgi:hypothetical protein
VAHGSWLVIARSKATWQSGFKARRISLRFFASL